MDTAASEKSSQNMEQDLNNVNNNGNKAEEKTKDEKVSELLFLGTFYHDSGDECHIDLIQFKGPVQITEIRVIPLGATVKLSNDSFQLGATNPSKLELEFFYNNLVEPENSTFGLIRKFDFDDKSNIQLLCNTAKIITDGIVVRGLYSTITLGCYGVHVDHVEVIATPEVKENDAKVDSDGREDLSPVVPSEIQIDAEKKLEDLKSPAIDELESEAEGKSLAIDNEPPDSMEVDRPQAIPTITTRVNFGSIGTGVGLGPDKKSSGLSDTPDKLDEFESKANTSPIPSSSPSVIRDTEDISDGEVPSTDEDMDNATSSGLIPVNSTIAKSPSDHSTPGPEIPPDRTGSRNGSRKTSLDTISPQRDQLSEPDGSVDDFPDPGFDLILSDEETPEFTDSDITEWREYLSNKTIKMFDPYSENFAIMPLQNFTVDCQFLKLLGKTLISSDAAVEKLNAAVDKFSISSFSTQSMEAWVETLETLNHLIPEILSTLQDGVRKENILNTLLFWAKKGTDLSVAASQPALPFKVRHIKAGIRLVQSLAISGPAVNEKLLVYPFSGNGSTPCSAQQNLLNLFMEKYVGVSSQLLILRAIDSTLCSKIGFRKFVSEKDEKGLTCFQTLIDFSLKAKFSVRVTFGLRSVLNKLKLMESIDILDTLVSQLISRTVCLDDMTIVDEFKNCMQFILNTANNVEQALAHPLRMFPVKALLEMPPNSFGLDPHSSFVKALEELKFMRICAVILCWKDVPVDIVSTFCDLILCLLNWEVGLIYLCNEGESTWTVIRALLAWEEEGNGTTALHASHCIEIMRCLDVITEASKIGALEDDEDVRSLQLLYSLMSSPVGRKALVDVLSLGSNITYLLKCIAPSESEPGYLHMNRNERSARKGYAVDILIAIIRYSESYNFLQQHGAHLHKFITSLREEGDSCEKLNDLLPFLKLTLNPLNFSYGGVEFVCETVKAKAMQLFQSYIAEDNWGFPPELITGVRILSALGVPGNVDDIKGTLHSSDADLHIKELKYELSLVKIHSMDCVSSFVKILSKICEEFSQPAIHAYSLVGSRGDAMISLVLPVIKLLRTIMTHVIQIRKTEFRDVTAIPALLQMHALMSSFPQSSMNHGKVLEINQNIIATLLAYTIPTLRLGEETEQELNKSTWTALVSETLKFTLTAPHTFVSGLTILSELLPLPLPMGAKYPLDKTECSEGVKLRKLWSAYLHSLSAQIQEMIGILCGSTHGRLLSVLKRVCLQLADLSPSTCLVVVRAILDSVMTSIESDFEQQAVEENSNPSSSVKAWVETAHGRPLIQCSAHSARLLGFLSTLVSNAAVIKGGLMQAIRAFSKVDEKYSDFLSLLCSVIASKPNQSTSIYHVQAQDHIVSIFQSLCDAQNNMLLPLFGRLETIAEPDIILANALPQRDSLNLICSALMGYLNTLEDRITTNGHVVEGVIRTFAILAETEYGFYQLRSVLEKYPRSLFNLTRVISKSEMENFEMGETLWPCINYLLEFLKSLITPKNESTNSLPPRLTTLRPEELRKCMGWNLIEALVSSNQPTINSVVPDEPMDVSTEELKIEIDTPAETIQKIDVDKDASELKEVNEKEELVKVEVKELKNEENPATLHPLIQLKTLLEKYMHSNDGEDQQGPLLTLSNYDPFELLQICDTIVSYIEDGKPEIHSAAAGAPTEATLPPPDLLTEVYAQRSVFVLLDKLNLDSLPSYWLTSVPPSFDLDVETSEADMIPCDVNSIVGSILSEVDLVVQIELLLKISMKGGEGKPDNSSPLVSHPNGDAQRKGGSLLGMPPRKMTFNTSLRGQSRAGFGRGLLPGPGRMGNIVFDPFRSRPPNTSRPPSLHVDDFVALETSGHNPTGSSPYNKAGMRTSNESFTSRTRASARGSPATRPYNSGPGPDRTRQFRSTPPVANYYQQSRNENNMPRGRYTFDRSPRGRGYAGNDRWSGDGRNIGSSSSAYGRQIDHMSRGSPYEDKFRSASAIPGSNRAGMPNRQPYIRNSYREAPMGRTGSNGSGVPSQRWRDKPRPFQR
ncbi:unnamed protein product [Allacma fusca]|nr:unnamed protein product [Allacma fusca]